MENGSTVSATFEDDGIPKQGRLASHPNLCSEQRSKGFWAPMQMVYWSRGRGTAAERTQKEPEKEGESHASGVVLGVSNDTDAKISA